MIKTLTKNPTNNLSSQEETILNWNEVLKKFQITFGSDVYESWIKNINLKKEFHHYVILSAPTRFVRDWIVSRYADKVLDIIKKFKKTIQRIEFHIEDVEESSGKINDRKSSKILPIENSLLNYNLFNSSNSFNNFVVGESNELAYVAAQKICSQS